MFIHSSLSERLGCFFVLAIVNSASMDIEMHESFWIIVSFGYIPRNGIAVSYGNSAFSFLRKLHAVFPPAAYIWIYIPTNNVVFPFLYTLSHICYL